MQVLDFDAHFNDVLNAWVEKNQHRFQTPDDMEDEAPEVYLQWLNTPADWLDGKTPGNYFAQFGDSAELCKGMIEYIQNDVSIPDPLLDRLCELADEQALLALASDKAAPCEARMNAIELLRQIESTLPMVEFLRWQVERGDEDEILDNALESLRQMGDAVYKPAKVAFSAADAEGKEALLDVLADFPGDEEVFQYTLKQFRETKDKRGLFAGYLAKLDDDRALEYLLDVAEGEDVSYMDFIEIRSAVERLGGEAPVRDWTDDPTYKAFKRMQPVVHQH